MAIMKKLAATLVAATTVSATSVAAASGTTSSFLQEGNEMSHRNIFARRSIAAALVCIFALTPAAHASAADGPAKEAVNSPSVQNGGKTSIEYRSEKDRAAFEKFGRYIHATDDGNISENIPEKERQADKDAASRIDEFVHIANAKQGKGEALPVTTYGNETKIDNWGPIVKVYISHALLSKVNKVLGAGGGVAGVSALLVSEGLAGPAGWVAAGLTALVAAGNLCDWNDQGIVIWKVPGVAVPACVPQK